MPSRSTRARRPRTTPPTTGACGSCPYFPGSVSGLGPGSPVTFQGLRVGHVTGLDLEYDAASDALRVPVRFEVEPERVADVRLAEGRGPVANTRLLVERGLRAKLESANLLTGQMQVALEMVADAEPAELRVEGDVLVLPTVPGQFAGITDTVNQLLAKLDKLPFEQIGQSVNDTLKGVDGLVNGPELKQSLVALQATLASVQDLAKQLDQGLAPAVRQLPGIASGLQGTVAQANRLLQSADRGYGEQLAVQPRCRSADAAAQRRGALAPHPGRPPDAATPRRWSAAAPARGCSSRGRGVACSSRRLAAAALPAACGSPAPTLYAIQPVAGAARAAGPRVVQLRPIGLARYLDRQQIVRSAEDYRLDVAANDWWGEPLGTMLARVLVEELSQRLPGATVIDEAGAITLDPDITVEINVRRLDAVADGRGGPGRAGRGHPAEPAPLADHAPLQHLGAAGVPGPERLRGRGERRGRPPGRRDRRHAEGVKGIAVSGGSSVRALSGWDGAEEASRGGGGADAPGAREIDGGLPAAASTARGMPLAECGQRRRRSVDQLAQLRVALRRFARRLRVDGKS